MDNDLLKKLRYKDGQAATVLNAPDGYQLGLRNETDGVFEFVLLFTRNADEVQQWLPKAIPLLEDDAVFWISYPKSSAKIETDLNRDILFKLVVDESAYRTVSNVAIDDKWSALRFRHKDKVKKGK